MAKKKQQLPPSVAKKQLEQLAQREADTTADANEMPVFEIALKVPIAKFRLGYEPRRCDVSGMSGFQRENLRRITNGLIAQAAKLKNGRNVTKPQDAIKWILESISL